MDNCIKEYIDSIFNDKKTIDFRVIGVNILTGIYNDKEKLILDINNILNIDDYSGVYVGLNSIRESKEVHNNLNLSRRSVLDKDITLINRIPFDFDPVREKNQNSTNYQVEIAYSSAMLTKQWLESIGWPDPIIAMSGNGYHLLYKCFIKPSPKLTKAFQLIYTQLYNMFSTGMVNFDRVVRNPSRIFRLYGTINKKSINTSTRPHRKTFCTIPSPYKEVTEKQIYELARYLSCGNKSVNTSQAYSRSKTDMVELSKSQGDYKTLNIVSMIIDMGIYKKPLSKGKHSIFCPWGSDHSSISTEHMTDSVVWESYQDVWPRFHCSHNSCAGKTIVNLINHVGASKASMYCTKQFKKDIK